MFDLSIPGFRDLHLEHVVVDYNGTLAVDGRLLPGVTERLAALTPTFAVHVITADTFGLAQEQLQGLGVDLHIIPSEDQASAKLALVERLEADRVVSIGNGRNDRAMLHAAALGIAVIQREGAAAVILPSADLLVTSILDAFDLLLSPLRLVATLRS